MTTAEAYKCKTIEVKRDQPQEIFALLVKLAMENGIETFQSDLYYDAIFLSRTMLEIRLAGGFFFSCRASGTAIDLESARNVTSGGTGEKVFFISIKSKKEKN